MLMVLWSVDPGDWRRPGVRAIVSNVLTRARAGSIVIMHDGGGERSQTIAALPQIINGLRQRHLSLVTVAQLLRDDPPSRHQPPPQLGGR
jgi:peptidoglycan/xylan/chitin deacetylase (PgdA/CDA1 family)